MATKTKAAQERVKVNIPIERNETDDVYVAVNGKGILIKRGVDVMIPPEYAEVLERSKRAKAKYLQSIRDLHNSQPE